MSAQPEKLQVASPRACNMQQPPLDHATSHATRVQPPSLKALARKALECNNLRNPGATDAPESVQQPCNETGAKVARKVAPETRLHLLALAQRDGVDERLVLDLPEAELTATAEQVAACDLADRQNILRAYLHALAETAERMAGRVQRDETARALCRGCGPVWVHPAVASAAPVVDGLPRLLGCPWCHVRHAGLYVPRPSVSCGECQHFIRDTVNPEGGMGRCNAGCDPARPYPNAKHQCARFTP